MWYDFSNLEHLIVLGDPPFAWLTGRRQWISHGFLKLHTFACCPVPGFIACHTVPDVMNENLLVMELLTWVFTLAM